MSDSGVAGKVAGRLSQQPGVVAVTAGSGWARGDALVPAATSIAIYYHRRQTPAPAALIRLASSLADPETTVELTKPGTWGAVLNGGGRLYIGEAPVDLLYRDVDLVRDIIDACQAGRSVWHYRAGQPYGVHTHSYLGELREASVLYDPQAAIAGLRERTTPYPVALRSALIDAGLAQAVLALTSARALAGEADIVHVATCLQQCIAALVQALYAVHEEYAINGQRVIRRVAELPHTPPAFGDITAAVLAQPGDNAEQLTASIDLMAEQLDAVREVCTQAR